MTLYKAFAGPPGDYEHLGDHQRAPWGVATRDPSDWDDPELGICDIYSAVDMDPDDFDRAVRKCSGIADLQKLMDSCGCVTVAASNAVLYMGPEQVEQFCGSDDAEARARAKRAMMDDLPRYEAWAHGTILYVSLIETEKYPGLVLICPKYDERRNVPDEFDEDEYADEWVDTTVAYGVEDARRVAVELLAAHGQKAVFNSDKTASASKKAKATRKMPVKIRKAPKASTPKATRKVAAKATKPAAKAAKSGSKASQSKKTSAKTGKTPSKTPAKKTVSKASKGKSR